MRVRMAIRASSEAKAVAACLCAIAQGHRGMARRTIELGVLAFEWKTRELIMRKA